MAQKTFADGDVLTASDLNTYCAGEGGAWTAWTPVVDQGASTNITKTINYSNYARYGRLIIWNFRVTMGAAGTANAGVTLTVPVTAATGALMGGGNGALFDTSENDLYSGSWISAGTTTVSLVGDWAENLTWGQAPNLALATGDVLSGSIMYEAAS